MGYYQNLKRRGGHHWYLIDEPVDKRLIPFAIILTVVIIFALAWTATAEEPKAVIYRGPGGSYVPGPGETAQQFEDGRLLVTRTNGEQVVIDLSGQLSAGGAKYEKRFKPNGEPYLVLVQSRATEVDLIQSEHDLRVMQDDREYKLATRRQAQDERNDQHDNRLDWSEETRDWKRDWDRAKDDKRDAEAQEKYEKRRQKKQRRDDFLDAADDIGDRVSDGADRAERIGRGLIQNWSKRR
jgi:hypothetical protein